MGRIPGYPSIHYPSIVLGYWIITMPRKFSSHRDKMANFFCGQPKTSPRVASPPSSSTSNPLMDRVIGSIHKQVKKSLWNRFDDWIGKQTGWITDWIQKPHPHMHIKPHHLKDKKENRTSSASSADWEALPPHSRPIPIDKKKKKRKRFFRGLTPSTSSSSPTSQPLRAAVPPITTPLRSAVMNNNPYEYEFGEYHSEVQPHSLGCESFTLPLWNTPPVSLASTTSGGSLTSMMTSATPRGVDNTVIFMDPFADTMQAL